MSIFSLSQAARTVRRYFFLGMDVLLIPLGKSYVVTESDQHTWLKEDGHFFVTSKCEHCVSTEAKKSPRTLRKLNVCGGLKRFQSRWLLFPLCSRPEITGVKPSFSRKIKGFMAVIFLILVSFRNSGTLLVRCDVGFLAIIAYVLITNPYLF